MSFPKMANFTSVFLVVVLLAIWTTSTFASSSHAMLSNAKSFAAGGVGGKNQHLSVRYVLLFLLFV
jgi:hypothetical protein